MCRRLWFVEPSVGPPQRVWKTVISCVVVRTRTIDVSTRLEDDDGQKNLSDLIFGHLKIHDKVQQSSRRIKG